MGSAVALCTRLCHSHFLDLSLMEKCSRKCRHECQHKCGFLRNGKQRVVLNREVFTWTNYKAQGLILGSLLFWVYINKLADELSSNAKLFADGTSLI